MDCSLSGCFVCGLSDRRALVDIVLGDGSSVSLCGTHALILRRSSQKVHAKSDLAALLRDRRTERRERRRDDVDELAVALQLGFSGERRRDADRRVSG